MKKLVKFVRNALLVLVVLVSALAVFLRVQYGGGVNYPDVSTPPKYGAGQLQLAFTYHEPIGNVAVSKDTSQATRLFFTVHPESRPATNKLMEVVNNQAVPYPSAEAQQQFKAPLGVFTDQQNRLWVIDHGNHGFDPVKLTAIDLATNQVVHTYAFPGGVAKKLWFFDDRSVAPNGKLLVVANVSFFGKKPSLAVYNLETGQSKNLLEGHPSMQHEGYVPRPPAKTMRFFGGLVDLLTGIDGIDFSRDGQYVYYAPMGHSGLFRIPTAVIADFSLSEQAVAQAVERVADKPLSDGIRTDWQGNVYITDIEHRGIYVVPPNGKGYTLINDERIRWADGLSLTNGGDVYLADSDIPNQMLQSKSHMAKHAPYHIFKFRVVE